MKSDVEIRPIAGPPEVEACARMMAASEPWITLQRDYAASLRNLSSPEKESMSWTGTPKSCCASPSRP